MGLQLARIVVGLALGELLGGAPPCRGSPSRRPRSRPASPLTSLPCALATSASDWPARSLVRSSRSLSPRYFAAAAMSVPNGRKTGRAAGPPGPPEAQRGVGDVGDVRLELGEHVVGLGLRELLGRDGLVELRLGGVDDRLLEAGEVLALRLGHVGQRLAGLQLGAQVALAQAQVLGRGGELVAQEGLGPEARTTGPTGPARPAGPEATPKPGPPRTPLPASMRFLSASA